MRWGVFILALAICLTLDLSFFQALAIGPVFPGVCGALVVYVALFAPRQTALWAALVTGIMLDLGSPALWGMDRIVHVIGPHALGFVFGAYLVLLLRSIVVRRNPLTVGMLVLPCLLAVSLVYMGIWSIRDIYSETHLPWAGVSSTGELGRMLGWAFYSAIIAIPIGWLLLLSWGLWKFDPSALRAVRR